MQIELQELCFGIVEEITNFGAFMNLGVMKGMIHISQTMEDYVNFSKSNTAADLVKQILLLYSGQK